MENDFSFITKGFDQWTDWIESVLAENVLAMPTNEELKKYVIPYNPYESLKNVFTTLKMLFDEEKITFKDYDAFREAHVNLLGEYSIQTNSSFKKNSILITLLALTLPTSRKNNIHNLIINERYLQRVNLDEGYDLHIALISEYINISSFEINFAEYLYRTLEKKIDHYPSIDKFFNVALSYFRINSTTKDYTNYLTKILFKKLTLSNIENLIKSIIIFIKKNSCLDIYEWYVVQKDYADINANYKQITNFLLIHLDKKYEEFYSDIFYNLLVLELFNSKNESIPPIIIKNILKRKGYIDCHKEIIVQITESEDFQNIFEKVSGITAELLTLTLESEETPVSKKLNYDSVEGKLYLLEPQRSIILTSNLKTNAIVIEDPSIKIELEKLTRTSDKKSKTIHGKIQIGNVI